MLRMVCPCCEKDSEIELIRRVEKINVRGEPIQVEVEYFKCATCGGEFMDLNSDRDPLAEAYRLYRDRKCMLQPDEIRQFRRRFGLTQAELGKLLGWGGATLSRYENGALQDNTHETALRLAMDPRNLLALIKSSSDIFTPDRKKELTAALERELDEAFPFVALLEERFGNYEPNQFSGYKRLDLKKLLNAALFFCKAGIFRTKLNKLLFYADFKHFKDHSLSITGARYLRFQYGPVPEHYDYYLGILTDEFALSVDEITMEKDGIETSGNKYYSVKDADLNCFEHPELETLLFVEKRFRTFRSCDISEFSHKEAGYANTPDGKPISYAHALQLNI